MLALVVLGGVAFGNPATDYIDAQMEIDTRIAMLHLQYAATAYGSGPEFEANLKRIQLEAKEVVLAAQAIEEWPGGDQGLNDAVAQRAAHSVVWFEQTLPAMVALERGPHPRDADQLQYETLYHLSQVSEEQDVERVSATLEAFAQANRVMLMDPGPLYPEPPELELALPGPPSALPADMRVSFAIGHYNEMVVLQDAVWEVWNQGVDLAPQALIAHQPELAQAVEQVQGVPPWMGDDTLTAALSATGETLLELHGLLSQAAELDMRLFLFGKKRRQRDALIDQVNAAVEPLNAEVDGAFQSFEQAWGILAYEQYMDQVAAWASGAQGAP